ncbi:MULTISPECIES: hypothetical protein [unclassified Rhizobium]|uniref:hypothetical protein n=1 Tax=unclassified Rhizobium TaxID=2613769 RepID=UPI0007EB762D|nr:MULTISPECIES: hypothetical protein [unclassified Rhizobium]ANL11958.1 hypothetical protein AMJ98_PA00012 [Rhizobium sp. N1341]ANM42803.1 hypothetical protein AMK03_PA00012 [Rhizobium sp. N741]
MGCERPTILADLRLAQSEDAAAYIAEFKAWFKCEKVEKKIRKAAKYTLKYLIDYNHTPTFHGGEGEPKPWVRLEGVPLPELVATNNAMVKDLRLSGLRLKTWSEGACRMIGLLNDEKGLPLFANTYNDRSTNLAEWFIHEQMMRAHFRAVADGKNPKEIGVVNMNDLMPMYLYDPQSQQEALRAKIVQMVAVGLWDADPPPSKGGVPWKIRAGPVAIVFHEKVFHPTIKHFKQFLNGSSKKEDKTNAV